MKRYFIFAALIAFLPMAYAMDSDGDGISDVIEASTGADPFSKYAVAVSVGSPHACALDDTGVVCWGSNQYGQTDVPPLSNPRTVSAGGGSHLCTR